MPTTAQGYINRANHALDLAQSETDPAARQAFFEMAETWLRLAEGRLEALVAPQQPNSPGSGES